MRGENRHEDQDHQQLRDDVQQESDRMKPLGAQFTMNPTKATGSTIAMLKDTCGNLIQIVNPRSLRLIT